MDIFERFIKSKPYLLAVGGVIVIALIWQLVVARFLYKNPIICEGTFRDRALPKQVCPLGSYCAKPAGETIGRCMPYVEFFKQRPLKFNNLNLFNK